MDTLQLQLIEFAQVLWEQGLIGSLEGNLSCRQSHDTLLITAAGRHKGRLNPDDVATVMLDGTILGGKPSSELDMHLTIYRERPDCQAVVHAHPPHATTMALCHQELPSNILPEALAVLGDVPLVPFGMPGTPALGESLVPYLPNHKAFILSNHGAVTLGRDLFDAYSRMETLERVCRVVCQAWDTEMPMVGLPAEAVAELRAKCPSHKL